MVNVDPNVSLLVARMVSESGELDVAAEKVAAKARGLASSHTKSGSYQSSFGTERVPGKKGVSDVVAYNDDKAAIPIEFGHTMKNGKFVPGLGVMMTAAHSV